MTYYEFLGQRHPSLLDAAAAVREKSSRRRHADDALAFAEKHFEHANEEAKGHLAWAIHTVATRFPTHRPEALQVIDALYSQTAMNRPTRAVLNSALVTLVQDPKSATRALKIAHDHFSEANPHAQMGLARVVLAGADRRTLAEPALAFLSEHFQRTRQTPLTAVRGALVEAVGKLAKHRNVAPDVLSFIADHIGDVKDEHKEKWLDTVIGFSLDVRNARTVLRIVGENHDSSGRTARRKMQTCVHNLLRTATRSAPQLLESIQEVARDKNLRLKAG